MYSILPTLVASIFLGYAVIVVCTQGFTRISTSFFVMCITCAVWQGTLALLFRIQNNGPVGLLLIKLGYLLILFVATSMYHFVTEITLLESERRYVFLSYAVAAILAVFLLTSTLLFDGDYTYYFGIYPKASLLHPIHVLQSFVLLLRGLYITYQQQKHANASRKIKLRLCIGAVLVFSLAAVDYLCNYGVESYPLGGLFITISLGIFTVAIVRFNLFDPVALAAYTMIANISHELRTPVNALRLLLDSSAAEAPESRDIIPQVKAITAHMTKLVENILLMDPDRPQNQHNSLIEDFELGDEIRATANLVHRSAATLKIDVTGCAGVNVRGDLTALRRIIINLLSNAFKFTERGRVTLIADAEYRADSRKVRCKIRVIDTGLGIPERMQNRIFDAFVTSGVQGGKAGIGLGLAISLELAHKLDGSLRLIRSKENVGSEFECVAEFSAAPIRSTGKTVAAMQSRRKRVLIAEDDPITAEAIQLIVRQLQHDIVHVATYQELCAALMDQTQIYDFAITDQRLPDGSGLDMIRYCREQGWRKDTTFVLMTAEVTDALNTAAREICDVVIEKPTTAQRIQELLGGPAELSARCASVNALDPAPLTMLSKSGATTEDLNHICNLFYTSANDTLNVIYAISPWSPGKCDEAVHRIQSACATVGAVALSEDLRELSKYADAGAAKKHFSRMQKTFDTTHNELRTLLQELTSHV